MKTKLSLLLTLCGLLFSTHLISQESLEGMKLGAKNSENQFIGYVAGIKGVIMAFELDDGRTFQIAYAPSSDGKKVSRLKKVAYDELVAELEKRYGIQFERVNSEKNEHDYFLEAYKGDVVYIVDVKYDASEAFPYDAMFTIVDLELEEIAIKQGK